MGTFRFAVGLFNALVFATFCVVVFTEGAMEAPHAAPIDGSGAALFLVLWALANAVALLVRDDA